MPTNDEEKTTKFKDLIANLERLAKLLELKPQSQESSEESSETSQQNQQIENLKKRIVGDIENLKLADKVGFSDLIEPESVKTTLDQIKKIYEVHKRAHPSIIEILAANDKAIAAMKDIYKRQCQDCKIKYEEPVILTDDQGKKQVQFKYPDDESLMKAARDFIRPPNKFEFNVYDEKGKIIAHSTGDGNLYHGNKRTTPRQLINEGDKFRREPDPVSKEDSSPKP